MAGVEMSRERVSMALGRCEVVHCLSLSRRADGLGLGLPFARHFGRARGSESGLLSFPTWGAEREHPLLAGHGVYRFFPEMGLHLKVSDFYLRENFLNQGRESLFGSKGELYEAIAAMGLRFWLFAFGGSGEGMARLSNLIAANMLILLLDHGMDGAREGYLHLKRLLTLGFRGKVTFFFLSDRANILREEVGSGDPFVVNLVNLALKFLKKPLHFSGHIQYPLDGGFEGRFPLFSREREHRIFREDSSFIRHHGRSFFSRWDRIDRKLFPGSGEGNLARLEGGRDG